MMVGLIYDGLRTYAKFGRLNKPSRHRLAPIPVAPHEPEPMTQHYPHSPTPACLEMTTTLPLFTMIFSHRKLLIFL
jgi:hypothetical protein